jgi:asparagine synthase (glutamine-hydrolysing)
MCGVAGIAYINERNPSRERLAFLSRNVSSALGHRGPDDKGAWLHPEGKLAFVHRRLSIFDLSSRGHQPMLDREGNAITFNGEIYNFRELRAQYAESDFHSETDTEVLLKKLSAANKLEANVLNELDGMFAFAYYSKLDDHILLAVDPAGKKPLYTYWDGKTFAFASEIKAFHAFESLNFEIDSEKLKTSLVFGYVPYPNTIYRYIQKLPAGHFQKILLRSAPEKAVPYWDVPLGRTDFRITQSDAESELRRLMKLAVKKRLAADVPVGCFLSGGLDSSVVTLEAAKLLPAHELHTFSAGFSEDPNSYHYDESKYARQVSKLANTIHREIQINAAATSASDIMRLFDEPFGDSSAIPTYLLCEKTVKHVKVALSGDGGDELFGGYLRFCAALLSERYKSLWAVLLSPVTLFRPSSRSFLGKLKRFRLALSSPLLKRLTLWNSFFEEGELHKFFGDESEKFYESIRTWDENTKGIPTGEKILYFNFKTYLFDDLLPKIDRMSMAHGLEIRCPFLDKSLIEFAFQLPTHYKFDAFRTKIILKNAYRGDLGAEITDRKKHGFAFPLETFLRTEETAQRIHRLFPEVKKSNKLLSPLNLHSKGFMMFSVEQTLQHLGLRGIEGGIANDS